MRLPAVPRVEQLMAALPPLSPALPTWGRVEWTDRSVAHYNRAAIATAAGDLEAARMETTLAGMAETAAGRPGAMGLVQQLASLTYPIGVLLAALHLNRR